MAEKFGTDNLKKVFKSVIGLTNEIAVDLQDKKITWGESAGLLDNLLEIPGVVTALPNVPNELADLSPEEKLDLENYIAQEFDIPNDVAEAKIEAGADVAVGLGKLIALSAKKPAA